MTVTATPRFSLRIPETWIEFDVWRATRTGDLTRLVDERLRERPELRPHRSLILRGLRDLAEDAERRGAVYCAAAADPIDGQGTLLAALMVFSTAGMPEPLLNTVDAIAAQITSVQPAEPTDDWRDVQIIDLDAGRAVRTRALTTIRGEVDLPIVSMQTLIPVPDGDRILDVVLTSPQPAIAAELLDLFDAISGTLAWESGPPTR